MLEDKIEEKDDENQRCFHYKVQIQDKSFRTKVRYNPCSKEEAVLKIQNQKEEIKELTLDFDQRVFFKVFDIVFFCILREEFSHKVHVQLNGVRQWNHSC